MDVAQRPHEARLAVRQPVPPDAEDGRHDGGAETRVPARHVGALHEHDFGLRVRGQEIVPEGDRRHVGDGAVVAQQGVPVAAREGGAEAVVFGVEGADPGGDVADAAVEGEGVGAGDSEDVQGGLHCCVLCLALVWKEGKEGAGGSFFLESGKRVYMHVNRFDDKTHKPSPCAYTPNTAPPWARPASGSRGRSDWRKRTAPGAFPAASLWNVTFFFSSFPFSHFLFLTFRLCAFFFFSLFFSVLCKMKTL